MGSVLMKPIRESVKRLHELSKCVKKEKKESGNNSSETVWSKCNVCIEANSNQHQHYNCSCGLNINDGHQHGNTTTAVDDDAKPPNSSFAHAVINMVGMLIGLGQLSTPYAIEKGGWGCALIFVIGLAIMCCYSCNLLMKCLEKNPKLRSYVDIGEHAFGRRGKLLASTFIYVEIFMALVSYTISLHDNLTTVFMGTHFQQHFLNKLHVANVLSSSQILTMLAVFVAVPSLWFSDLSSISFLSTLGILMSLVIFLSVASTPIFGGVKVNHTIPLLQLRNVPSVSGIYFYSYAGHVVFPDLYRAMKDPSKFTKVSIVSFSVVTILYTTLGFLGAKMFGGEVKSQITLSMPHKSTITKIGQWATVITPITKYALEFAPLAIHFHHKLPTSMSRRSKMIARGTVGSVVLLVILALALSVPYFESVLGLTGSLVSVAICLIFPCAFYTKICWPQIPKLVKVLNFCLIAFGVVIGVMGTISSSRLLLNNL
ncbi:amino acid transporter AVT1H [Senna tora]|uniref:Amino acid transporter AVT1H n=1 Tax=Senna tora TaxID=362788 RepID=A0A835CBV4_9FABA|nr:amino acid transporter AVT1H [Senna tora]